MSFIESLEKSTNTSFTENGALSNHSTLDPVLDFFSKAGALRSNPNEAVELFNRAYSADKNLAVKALFYLRDIRGGLGERNLFRVIFNQLDSDTKHELVKFIPEYGRFDDINPVEFFYFIDEQLTEDLESDKPSLLAKWLPSANASSKKSRKQALELISRLGVSESDYRKALSSLRAKIRLLEHKMSQREWSAIEYDKIPSQAHRKHIKAFFRNDETRYKAFLEAVKKGDKKINADTLYAYEVYRLISDNYRGDSDTTADALWNALPDYTNGQNALVVADVSGSMTGGNPAPIDVSVSLALYFADRNKGTFHNYFLNFSDESRLQHVTGETLRDKFNSIERSDWGMSTNLQSSFDAILEAAINDNTPQEEMPATLYIISDMQFNQATHGNNKTNLQAAREKFEAAGYKLPQIVFWNVRGSNDSPATKYDEGVTLVSGSSQSVFQYVFSGMTPIESMLEVLGSPRYEQIVLTNK